jgi:hypothetical protein
LEGVFTALDPLVALFGDTPPVHTAYYAVSELCHGYDQESSDSGSPAFHVMNHVVARRRLADLARYSGLAGHERLRSDLGDEHRERARRAAAEYADTVSEALRGHADAIARTPPAGHTDEPSPRPAAAAHPAMGPHHRPVDRRRHRARRGCRRPGVVARRDGPGQQRLGQHDPAVGPHDQPTDPNPDRPQQHRPLARVLPDGRRLVSAGGGTDLLNAHTMRLWDLGS